MKILLFDIEPYYQLEIYEDGSHKFYSLYKGKALLKTPEIKGGYTMLRMGPKRSILIHKAVAEKFLGPRPEGLTINHIDGNKRNNHPSNLEYMTRAENIQHAIKLGLHISTKDPELSGRYKHGRAVLERRRDYKREWYLENRDRILADAKERYMRSVGND